MKTYDPALAKVGDRFRYCGTEVEVIGEPSDCRDRFGRPLRQIRGRRSDTGAEGSMMFGPGGVFADYGVIA